MPDRPDLSRLRAVLFDVDGTLVHTLDGVILGIGDTCEQHFGYRPKDDEIRELIGRPIRDQLRQFANRDLSPEQLDEMTAHTIELFEQYKHLEKVFDPAVEALELCHQRGYMTALVTSKNSLELERFLQRFSGVDAVTTTVCSNDVRSPKPAPDCALRACEKMDVTSDQAVFIGDSVYDIRCAHDAGMPAVAVAYGSSKLTDLSAESPEVLLETPEALLVWVDASLAELPCPERSQKDRL